VLFATASTPLRWPTRTGWIRPRYQRDGLSFAPAPQLLRIVVGLEPDLVDRGLQRAHGSAPRRTRLWFTTLENRTDTDPAAGRDVVHRWIGRRHPANYRNGRPPGQDSAIVRRIPTTSKWPPTRDSALRACLLNPLPAARRPDARSLRCALRDTRTRPAVAGIRQIASPPRPRGAHLESPLATARNLADTL